MTVFKLEDNSKYKGIDISYDYECEVYWASINIGQIEDKYKGGTHDKWGKSIEEAVDKAKEFIYLALKTSVREAIDKTTQKHPYDS